MAVKPFSKEQLNFFKFSALVLDEFPKVLRHVFIDMWNSKVAVRPGFSVWDDSAIVRNMLCTSEGGTTDIPTNKSIEEWDCTALFKATIYAKTFAILSGTSVSTLNDLHLKKTKPVPSFHPSVKSSTGDQDETYALAIDQLRLLRNRLCHLPKTEMAKSDFDNYVQLVKSALSAVNVDSTFVGDIEKMSEDDFPTEKVRQLIDCRVKELQAIIMLHENMEQKLSCIDERTENIMEKIDKISWGDKRNAPENKQNSWFEDTFLDRKHKLSKEIHEKLRSFSWLRGAYGLIGPTKKIQHPHLYLTIRRGVKKSDVRRELQEEFKCNTEEYFELLQEPERELKIKYLGNSSGRSHRSNNESMASVKAVPGDGVLAAPRSITDIPNPLRMPEENEGDRELGVGGKGTLTMFCSSTGHHYALTCFHVACAGEETSFNAAFNKIDNIQKIYNSLRYYETRAKLRQYYFIKALPVQNNNEAIASGDSGSSKMTLGTFEKCHFDNECDILSIKITDDVEIDCKVADVTSPDWKKIWDELHERVTKRADPNPVKVEKTGCSSGLTYGQIISCDFSYYDGASTLYLHAIVIKGYPGSFLESGDSGSLVFFRDSKDQKQVFAYGVCEVDELTLPQQRGYENAQEQPGTTKDSSEVGTEEEDDIVLFQEEGETSVLNASAGPYFICLPLDTALEKLGVEGSTCFNNCGSE